MVHVQCGHPPMMMREEAILVEPRPSLAAGDKVRLAHGKRRWDVRGVTRGGRFVILTQPFNVRHTVLYAVIDFDRGVRGRDDYYGLGYETDEQVADALHEFQHTEDETHRLPSCDEGCLGGADVSYRTGNHVRLDLTHINGEPTDWSGQPV